MIIETASKRTLNELTNLATKLWPDNSWESLRTEFEELLASDRDVMFLAKIDAEYVGFIHMCLRVDYVEGSSTSPVGYIEGIYVEEKHRKKGISKRLIKEGEEWSKSLGCTEIASDTEWHNEDSQAFHKKIGFKEAGRIVSFIKDIQ